MKKLNYPLILGAILLIALMLISFYPDVFTQADPYGKQRLSYTGENGKMEILVPPIAPGEAYPWGTDHYGRDMQSLIFYGAKVTIMLAIMIALGRLIIALPIAIAAAYRNRFFTWLIKQFNILFSAFPIIVVVLVLGNVRLFHQMFSDSKMMAAAILIILGWSRLAHLLMKKVQDVLQQDFIEGEIAIGKNKWEIALQNIIPHSIPSIIVLFFLEVAGALLILAQLGILGLLLSGGYSDDMGDLRMPFEFDWASILSVSNYLFGTGKDWIVFYPAAAFALSIVGFNLFGEGLRIEFDKRESRVISFIRNIPAFLSPLRFIYEVKHFAEHKKSIYQKTAFWSAVLLIAFFPQAKSLYDFDVQYTFNQISELSSPKYFDEQSETKNNKETALYIADKLQEYGLQPFDGKYIHEFDIAQDYKQFKDAKLSAVNEKGEKIDFESGMDFAIGNYFYGSQDYEMVFLKPGDFSRLDAKKIEFLRNKALVIDFRAGTESEAINAYRMLGWKVSPKVYIAIQDAVSGEFPGKLVGRGTGSEDKVVIFMSSNKGDELLKLGGGKLSLSVLSDSYGNTTGANIIGCIPGTDESLKDEYIVIGSHIDYPGDDIGLLDSGILKYGGTALELEIAKKFAESGIKPKKTILFAFWDGPLKHSRGSGEFVKGYFMGADKKVFYIDLKTFANKDSKKLLVDSSRVIPQNKMSQSYIRAIKKHAARNDVDLAFSSLYPSTAQDFMSSTRESVILDTDKMPETEETAPKDITGIDDEKLDKIGQMILDTIVEIASKGAE